MDISVQYVDPVKKDLISCNDWGQLWSNCKRGSSTVGSLVEELGSALEDALVLLSTSVPPIDGCEACSLERQNTGRDANKSVIVTSQKKLEEHAILPCSINMLSCYEPVSGKDKIPNTASDGQSSLESGNSASTSNMSYPVSLKLVSAMKGGREKQGLHVGNLSVSWASDVYDPPATSQSHTVSGHHQHCPATSKKGHRHKHKGKSPRSGCIERKHHRKASRSSSKVAGY